jgi:tRNA threonylcarbamoyladenosine dehydratase
MLNQFSRSQLLFGKEAMEKLAKSRVAIFGIGGVGGNAVEALVRSGVQTFDIFDDDRICLTNLNRQIIATRKTIGKYKVDVMKERILDINPKCIVNTHKTFFLPDNSMDVDFTQFDYVIDCVDTVSAKIELVLKAQEANVPIISAMGAGNKMDPTKFVVTDIYKTSLCPLARVMRQELRKRGVKKLKVVYSTEKPMKPINDTASSCKTNCICPKDTQRTCLIRREIPGSNAFVPSVCGLIAAGEVLKDLTIDCR